MVEERPEENEYPENRLLNQPNPDVVEIKD
jgi:hypothetical protein